MKYLVLSLFSINLLSIFDLTFVAAVSSDCIELNNFLGRSPNSECCNNKLAQCDDTGSINKLTLSESDISSNVDFSHFPIFSNMKNLNVGVPNLNNNLLPSRFFDQPKLEIMTVRESNISSIPSNINKNCQVTEINLDYNEITEFPNQFSNLPKLEHLYLKDNKISGTLDLGKFKTLNQLDVGSNQIEDIKNIPGVMATLFAFNNPIAKIPDEVAELVDLNEFDFSNTRIKELPPDLFKLSKLIIFKISNNDQLNAKIINFGNKNIKECSFEGTKISCYQPETCASIDAKSYPACSASEIEEIKSKQSKKMKSKTNKTKDDDGSSSNSIGLIIGAVIILVIVGFLFFLRKKRNDDESSYDDKNYDDVIEERKKEESVDNQDDLNTNEENNNNNNQIENSMVNTSQVPSNLPNNNNDYNTNFNNGNMNNGNYLNNNNNYQNNTVPFNGMNTTAYNGNSIDNNFNNYNNNFNNEYNNNNNNVSNNFNNSVNNNSNNNNNLNANSYYNNPMMNQNNCYPNTTIFAYNNNVQPMVNMNNVGNPVMSNNSNINNVNNNNDLPPSYDAISNNLHNTIAPTDQKRPLN